MRNLSPKLLFASFVASSIATAAVAQDSTPTPAPAPVAAPPYRADNDITVTGFNAAPINSALPGQGYRASRAANSNASQFVRCMRGAAPKLLRPIVEGHARDGKTQDALDRVIRTHTGCYRDFSGVPTPNYYGECNPVAIGGYQMCRAVYDRGALIEDAFKTYAPKFMLLRGDTLNRDTIARFRAREAGRGKFRSPIDRKFYETVACMVQAEPERAIRLLRAEPGLDKEARFRQQMIQKTPFCTNNAKRVQVDPYQFRIYVADAVYHWTIAAKNVETLIPAS